MQVPKESVSTRDFNDVLWSVHSQTICIVVCSYNAVNGIPVCLSPLMKAARDQWGFKG